MARATTELAPWRPILAEPFRELENMRREMDRIWGNFFSETPMRRGEALEWGEWFPEFDLSETKNELIVKAEVPGINPKDVSISLVDNMLTIKGEKKQEKEEKEENYHLLERSYGSFTRSVRLPQEVQSDKITAAYKNGLLKVTLPKSEEAKTKEIKIKVE